MASPMSVQNGQFVFERTTDGAGTYSAVLSTENKFVDKNIGISIITPSASNPVLDVTDITSSISMGTATNGVYNPTTTIAGNVNISTAGWITTGNKSVSEANVKIGKVNQSILQNGETTIASGAQIQPAISDQIITITEGYSPARTITVKSSASGIAAEATVVVSKQATAPTVARTATTATGANNIGSGNASTTAPSSGYFVSLQATAPATTMASTDIETTINTSGYLGDPNQISVTAGTTQKAGSVYYLPITSGVTAANTANAVKYTTDGSNSGINATDVLISGTGSNSEPNTANTYYVAFTASGSSKVTTAGWLPEGALDTASQVKYFNVNTATITASSTNASATTTVAPGTVSIAKNTTAVTGKTRLNDSNDIYYKPQTATTNIATYYIAIKASAAANTSGATSDITGTTTAAVTTAGYAYSALTGSGSVTGTATAKTSAKDSSVYYIPIPTAAFTVSDNLVYCTTAGYVPAGSTSSPIGTIASGTITNNASLGSNTSSGNINRGSYIKIGKGYYDSDIYYRAQPNSGTYTVTGAGNSISVDGYANINVASTSVTTSTNTSISGTTVTRATATWGTGWISSGSISAATFRNTATTGTTYIDISNTNEAPILTNGVLYINRGFVDDLQIDLGKLIPDTITDKEYAPAAYIRSGYAAYGADGNVIAGTMGDVTPTLAVSASNTTYFTAQASSSGASFSITPSYTNSTAGYLTQHTSAQNGSAQYYKIKTTSLSGGSGNVTLQADNSQTNSVYKTSSDTFVSVVDSAPATTTEYVYIKVQGSGSAGNSAAGWLAANQSATGSSIKYIRMVKYDGSYSTGTGT